jgi:hypothetical protein
MKRKEHDVYLYVYFSTSNNFIEKNEKEEEDFTFLKQAFFF